MSLGLYTGALSQLLLERSLLSMLVPTFFQIQLIHLVRRRCGSLCFCMPISLGHCAD